HDTRAPAVCPLSLHDALPIWATSAPLAGRSAGFGARHKSKMCSSPGGKLRGKASIALLGTPARRRSASCLSVSDILAATFSSPKIGRDTSELQSLAYLVCRLL